MTSRASIGTFVRTFLMIGAAISLMAMYQTELQTQALLKFRTRYKWVLLLAVFAFNVAAGIYAALRHGGLRFIPPKLRLSLLTPTIGRVVGFILLLAPLPILWYAKADFFGRGLEAFFRWLWLFWWMALVQTIALKLLVGSEWFPGLATALLLDGVVAELYTLSLAVSAYPFSMGWSEASRFYYGSLVFSRSIYGVTLPLSIWHGSRYLLLSIPFLIKDLPLWGARLWQALLWLVMTALSSWAFIRRLRPRPAVFAAILGAWFFLYLFQGAVYYHLQVCVIIILLAVAPSHPWRSLVAVAAASFWAGLSRLNWFPVPAMLAIALYLLERPITAARGMQRYFWPPVLWGLSGLLFALAGQAFYIAISGNTNLEAFGSSLTSALLWYRWFPSPTNPIGVMPGILLVSLPLWVLAYWLLRGKWQMLHPIRWIGLAFMLILLFVGGLVVSTKIGGGGDLHNMDAYMVLLAIIAGYFLVKRAAPEAQSAESLPDAPWPILTWMLLVPVAFSLLRLSPPFTYDAALARADVTALRQNVQTYSQSGDVLFMYERQLLTFGMVPGIRIVPDYEVVSLMEMAISGNEPYLDKFYADLASHRFAAIVAHPQNLGVETGDFIEESNAWNRLVAQPLLCQYKPALTLPYSKVQILVPRAKPCPDFPPAISTP